MNCKEQLERFARCFIGVDDWHIHSDYTDGSNTVREMCRSAERKGLRFACFLEHVRSELTYDYSRLMRDVQREGTNSSVVFRVGAEAKVLPDGSVDISEMVAQEAWCVFVAFHGGEFPTSESFVAAMRRALCDSLVDGWAHPLYFGKSLCWSLSRMQIKGLAKVAAVERVLVEYSLKKPAPRGFLEEFVGYGGVAVRGSDAHKATDILSPAVASEFGCCPGILAKKQFGSLSDERLVRGMGLGRD